MPEIQKYSLRNELQKADETLMGSPSLLGMTMLTYPNYINSMRSTMFTSHLKQFLTLILPQFPYVFTNNENLVGKHSSGYKQTKSPLQVYRKIVKFEDIVDNPTVYKLFVFDVINQKFDVIERKEMEDLTENFGYEYLNDVIDSFNEGDIIDEDTVLFHSTSYDEDMNYGYGLNVTVAYTLEPFTSEDAAIASMSIAKEFACMESDVIKIGLNNNDYLINLYGDKKHYVPLPEIGDTVSNVIAVSRRQFNNQLLYDFKDSSLKKILDGDIVFYIDKDVEVIDYVIYNNSEERNDSPFYEQINKYIDAQDEYYRQIIETCEEIMESGYEYSREIDYLYKRAQEMVDKEKKWKEGDSIFGNIEIEIHIKRKADLAKGCKFTGRFGNKSVVAKIEADENMPYTKDGRRVDVLLNLLAIINRTTSFPLFEIFINGCSYQCRQKMMTLPTLEEKADLLFDYIEVWNEKQAFDFRMEYNALKKKEKEAYIQDAIDNGILIHQLPMWESKPIFYRCLDMMEKFDFIKEDDLYIKKWGREYKVLTKYFIGEQYILRLKQSDRRGFSARSTGALDTKSLPTRSFKSKSHQERISSSCIRFGEYESLNFSIGILPEDIVLFHALYRTSIKARKDLIHIMFDDNDEVIHQIDATYTSRVAEIFNVVLKSLGIGLEFVDEDSIIRTLNDDIVTQHELDGTTVMCTDYEFYMLERMNEIKEIVLRDNPVLTGTRLTELIEETMKDMKYINGPLMQELGDFSDLVEKENQAIFERIQAEKVKEELKEESDELEKSVDEVLSSND